jgi:DNA-binding NarL/FixJ family response regulator
MTMSAHLAVEREASSMDNDGRILFADDEELFRNSIRTLLERSGFSCRAAADSADAIRALGAEPFDILVADINMPGNRSLELLEHCREHYPDLPVVIITGYPSVRTAVDALRLGVVDYLTKPVRIEELRARIVEGIAKGATRRRTKLLASQTQAFVDAVQAIEKESPGTGEQVARGAAPPAPRTRAAAAPTAGLEPEIASRVSDLSRREREILRALLQGQGAIAIGRELFISANTVRNHVRSIYKKLGVHSRLELARRLWGVPL